MNKLFVFIFFVLFYSSLLSQFISSVGTCVSTVKQLYADSITNQLYVAGFAIGSINNNDTLVDCVVAWDNQQWSALKGANHTLKNGNHCYSLTRFKNELYIAGELSMPANGEYYGLMKWKNADWIPVKDSTFPNRTFNYLLSTDSLLYIGGQFDTIAGIVAHNVATFDGTNYATFPDYGDSFSSIECMELYNNELYIGGNIVCPQSSHMQDIIRWNGSQWASLGNGLSGLQSYISCMTTFEGKLIVGGYMKSSLGDPGNGCAAWNGTDWISMNVWAANGTGVVRSLTVYRNDLYAVAEFNLGGAGTSALFKWKGTYWEQVVEIGGGTNQPRSLVVWNDDIYIGGVFNVAGIQHQGIIKYNATVGISQAIPFKGINIYPNPTENQLYISFTDKISGCNMDIIDIRGNSILSTEIHNKSIIIDISHWQSGVYYVVIDSNGQKYCSKFVKK